MIKSHSLFILVYPVMLTVSNIKSALDEHLLIELQPVKRNAAEKFRTWFLWHPVGNVLKNVCESVKEIFLLLYSK